MEKRVISTQVLEEDIKNDKNLRPQTLDHYIGQQKAKENDKKQHESMIESSESSNNNDTNEKAILTNTESTIS